VYRLVTIVRE